MADEQTPDESLTADVRARLRSIVTLVQSSTTPEALRLAASELARVAELGEAGAILPPPPTLDLHLHFATEEELARTAVGPDDDAAREIEAIRDRLGPEVVERLREAESSILRRIAEDPSWAVEFALRPLSALRELDPPLPPELLEALEQVGGGPEEAFRDHPAQIRLVTVDRATHDEVEGRDRGDRPGPPDVESSPRQESS